MSIGSRLAKILFKLPPADTHDVVVEKDLEVPMPDGVTLLADHYYPRNGPQRPTVLVRSPYGRSGFFGFLHGRPFAERGFQVLIQSCRGTFGSGGDLNPFHQERADGLATVQWLKAQEWFNGQFVTAGVSYLGIVQWAIAAEAGPEFKAMSTWFSSSEVRGIVYPGEAFWLESALGWTHLTHRQAESRLGFLGDMLVLKDPLQEAYSHLPLSEADQVGIGKRVEFWQDWLVHDRPGDEWWAACDFTSSAAQGAPPNHLIGGWYDIFLPQTLRDYRLLKAAGRAPYLTIGPWAHTDMGSFRVMINESLDWFRAHLSAETGGLRESSIRIYVMGADDWRDVPEFPPPGMQPQRWHLMPDGGLAPGLPAESEPDRYRYDPADPTPNVGGAGLGRVIGPKDNRRLEARPDVLTYSSAPLERPVEIIGPLQVELYVRSSLEYTDFFARLNDVAPSGKSTNISDNLIRLVPGRPAPEADGCLKVVFELWPTAYRFGRGHRIRLLISSGAFPRWARNPGSGEPLASATTLKAADQSVYHDPDHPSAIVLPVG